MKRILSILIAVIVVAVLALTCPDKKEHQEVICDTYAQALTEDDGETDVVSMIANSLTEKVANLYVANNLTLKNYFVCNVGQLKTNEGVKTVSLGVLGHVFVFGKEQLKEKMEDK